MKDAKVAPSAEETKDGAAPPKKGVAGVPETEAEKNKPKVSRKDKNYYLLMSKTEEYADDSELYNPRISRDMRLEYWEKMVDQKSRRKPEKGHMTYQEAWMQGDYDVEGPTYPSLYVLQLAIIKSQIWDYLYLILLLLYLLVVVVVYDGLGNIAGLPNINAGNSTEVALPIEIGGNLSPEIAANAAAVGLSSATMILPVVFMLFVQVPPSLGMFYFVTRCNDLVKYKARTTKFGGWAFLSILISQAVEYYFYGGADNVKSAGKCAYGSRAMALFGEKKIVLPDLDAMYDREPGSDDEEEFRDDPYPEGHLTIDQRVDAARKALEEDPDNPELQALVQGQQEMSFLQKILKDKREKEEEDKARIKAEELVRESVCTDWTEWNCMVCQKPNKRPTHPPSVSDIFFGSKGIFFKRTFAIIRPRRDAPQCSYCRTYADYVPPLGSAHIFPYNKAPYRAFNRYPIKTPVHAGLLNTTFSIYANRVSSFLFGLRNNSDSLLVYNDWRLRLYLNGRFPETPRQVKKKDELYQIGEFLECKLQKSDWQRCQVLKSRKNHTYDIRYDPGDELRLVEEKELRLPPEKRSYAYLVEMTMSFLVLSFPVGILASQVITPALFTFFPFCASLFLLFQRITRYLTYFRRYKYAGCVTVAKLSLFYSLPLIVMLIASALPLLGMPWMTTAGYWIATKIISLPILYIMKPHFAVFGLVLFIQTSAGLYMLAAYADGTPIVSKMYYTLAPLVTATLTLMFYRRNLDTFVDVSMVIRPPLNFIKPENICLRLYRRFFPDPNLAPDVDPELQAAKQAEQVV